MKNAVRVASGIFCTLLVAATFVCSAENSGPGSDVFSEIKLPWGVTLDEGVLRGVRTEPLVEKRLAGLRELARVEPNDAADMRKKGTALILLSRVPSRENIEILLENLAFRDEGAKIYPSVIALSMMGDAVVEPVFRYIKSTDDPVVMMRGAEVLQAVLCKNADCSAYHKWLEGRMDGLSDSLRMALGLMIR